MNMWDDGKEEIEDGDEEENLDGQACKGRGRLHHQGVVGRLWVGGALGLGGGQLGASSGQGARAGWRGPKLPDSSRLPAASRDHLGRWQRITKWSPAPARPPSGAIDAQAAATTWHQQQSTTRSDELEIRIWLKKVWRYFDSLWHWCPDPKYGESSNKWASLLRVTTCTFCPFASGQNHFIVPLVKLGNKHFLFCFNFFSQ